MSHNENESEQDKHNPLESVKDNISLQIEEQHPQNNNEEISTPDLILPPESKAHSQSQKSLKAQIEDKLAKEAKLQNDKKEHQQQLNQYNQVNQEKEELQDLLEDEQYILCEVEALLGLSKRKFIDELKGRCKRNNERS